MRYFTKKSQTGVALFVCLMILLILSLFGISAMRMMTSQNMISSSSQGADISFDAAETGINRAIVDAQALAKASGTLPTVRAGESTDLSFPADSKGITTIAVAVSVPDDMSDAMRKSILETKATMGAFGNDVEASTFRFSSTSTVEALDISTTHVQDTVVFHMK